MGDFNEIQKLLQDKADCQARINLIPYDGTPEIKEIASGKYLYIRKRVGSRLTSTYVGNYSDDLYQLLLRNAKELRELRKNIRKIDKQLASLGYVSTEVAPRIMQNLDFARANMKANIYDQAVLEGVATSFPQTEDIIENGTVNGMTASDIQKILNLKHAWEFVLDSDVIQAKSDYHLLCHIAKLVNEGFYTDGGRIRSVPVSIGGSTYKPPLPIENQIKEQIDAILNSGKTDIDVAIELCMFSMKTQIFIDGSLGYVSTEVAPRIMQNLDFARANMKANIYDQAVLEGVATSFPQTEDIIENGTVNGMTASDIQKILNLKHAWEFVLDSDVIQAKSDYHLLCHIAKLVNEGFYTDGGRIRSVPVSIGGSTYKPPLPIENQIKEQIDAILNSGKTDIDVAIELCMFSMKTQIFIDGNKRAAVIYANHYLIAHGQGFLVIPEDHVTEFKKKLVAYYEGEDLDIIRDFLKKNCWKNF